MTHHRARGSHAAERHGTGLKARARCRSPQSWQCRSLSSVRQPKLAVLQRPEAATQECSSSAAAVQQSRARNCAAARASALPGPWPQQGPTAARVCLRRGRRCCAGKARAARPIVQPATAALTLSRHRQSCHCRPLKALCPGARYGITSRDKENGYDRGETSYRTRPRKAAGQHSTAMQARSAWKSPQSWLQGSHSSRCQRACQACRCGRPHRAGKRPRAAPIGAVCSCGAEISSIRRLARQSRMCIL